MSGKRVKRERRENTGKMGDYNTKNVRDIRQSIKAGTELIGTTAASFEKAAAVVRENCRDDKTLKRIDAVINGFRRIAAPLAYELKVLNDGMPTPKSPQNEIMDAVMAVADTVPRVTGEVQASLVPLIEDIRELGKEVLAQNKIVAEESS